MWPLKNIIVPIVVIVVASVIILVLATYGPSWLEGANGPDAG